MVISRRPQGCDVVGSGLARRAAAAGMSDSELELDELGELGRWAACRLVRAIITVR